jgi:hypothetical protein
VIYGDTVSLLDPTLRSRRTYDVVAKAGDYDYSWTEAAILRDADGALFYAFGSGCSCYSFDDNVEVPDLVPVKSWQEAVQLAKSDLTDNEVVSLAEACLRGSE